MLPPRDDQEIEPVPLEADGVEKPARRLVQTVEVGGSPGSTTGTPRRTPPRKRKLRASLLEQYVSAASNSHTANTLETLSRSFDDLTDSFGNQIYEEMMLDPQIESDINTLRTFALRGGVTIIPAELPESLKPARQAEDDQAVDSVDVDQKAMAEEILSPSTTSEQDLAQEIADFCQANIDDLETPLADVLWDLLEGLVEGHRLAEQSYEIRDDPVTKVPRLYLVRIIPKPRESVAFVVDVYRRVIGILAVIPGVSASASPGSMFYEVEKIPNLLPTKKFLRFTARPKNNDPRGRSVLRGVYKSWWMKQQVLKEYLLWLANCASPGLIGFTPDGVSEIEEEDEDGVPTGRVISPEVAMTATLVGMKNGSAASFPFGSAVQQLEIGRAHV